MKYNYSIWCIPFSMKVIAVVIEVGILKSSYIVTNFHDYFTGSAGTNFPPFISLKGF